MKKNLLSVLVLVLVVVNIAMSAVMMISVIGTNKKTADLMTSIASVMQVELYNPGGLNAADVPLADTETHTIPGMMVALTRSSVDNGDGTTSQGRQQYLVFDLMIMMNTKHEDYEEMGANIADREGMIKTAVEDVISGYTEEQCAGKENLAVVQDEVLRELQRMFNSDFIFKVSLSGVKFGS